MSDILPFEKLIESDTRNLAFRGPITTDALQRLFQDWQIKDDVPEDVKKQFEVAKKLFVVLPSKTGQPTWV